MTAGCGWVKCAGEPKREIRAGDVVVCSPGEKHWHGANVSVAIEDVPPIDCREKVYEPEIARKRDKLFKKPGYGPLNGA